MAALVLVFRLCSVSFKNIEVSSTKSLVPTSVYKNEVKCTFLYEGINKICPSPSHSINAFGGGSLLVIRAVSIHSAPTFTIELKTKMTEAFLASPTSTLGYGVIQIMPVDMTSKISDQLGEWPGTSTAVPEAANWFKFRKAGFRQLVSCAVFFILHQAKKENRQKRTIFINCYLVFNLMLVQFCEHNFHANVCSFESACIDNHMDPFWSY